jgi:hypothetical protein
LSIELVACYRHHIRLARVVIVVVIIDVIVCVTVRTVCAAEGDVDLVAPLTCTVSMGGAGLLVKPELVVEVGTMVKVGFAVWVLGVVRLTDDV